MSRIVGAAQGVYHAITGIWPIVSIATFEAVTGPKTDDFLVRTVGLLALAISIALGAGATRHTVSRETVVLAVSAALAFGLVDVYYVLRATLGPIYLVDAVAEMIFVLALLGAWAAERARRAA